MRILFLTLMLCHAIAAVGVAEAQSSGPDGDSRPGSQQGSALPSITLPLELDRVLRDYERGWRAGDAAALAALFAEDGFVLQGGRPPVRGRTGVQSVYTGSGGGDLRLRALAYATADTLGFIIGAYSYGDEPGDVGKFTLTLKRSPAGRWLIFSDMDNTSRRSR